MRLFYFLIVASLFSGCNLTAQPKTALTVDLYNTTNDLVGTAKFNEVPDGVEIKLKVAGVPAGYHGVHIHETAKCEAPEFKSAGNHFNPEDKEHGLMNALGAHLGDLPNVEANGSGEIDETLTLPNATLLKGDKSLVEKGGRSIIITADADDGMTQVSGNSGKRIICGVITSESKPAEDATDPADKESEEESK